MLEKPLVNFLIIGGMKCGTTTLDAYLRKHPSLSFPKKKELHYFDTKAYPNTSWYHGFFEAGAGSESSLFGESTPRYCIAPRALPRIKAYNPDMRLIFIVRNPVHRAVSQIGHTAKIRGQQIDCWDILVDDIRGECLRANRRYARNKAKNDSSADSNSHLSIHARGRYIEQLKRIESYFSLDQVCIVFFEEMIAKPDRVLEKIFDFLSVPKIGNSVEPMWENLGNYDSPGHDVYAYLSEYYKPYNELLRIDYGLDVSAWNTDAAEYAVSG